jgi:hypothetical protein
MGRELEHGRDLAADKTRRQAQELGQKAIAEAERVATELLTGEAKEEGLHQLGMIYGGLIGVAALMVQPFLAGPTLDTAARISVIAFAVAIPLLAALILVNRQEVFRRRQTTSVIVTIAQVIAQGAAFVGLVAGFWHITWVAGLTFLVTGFVALGVHSAGFWRVESPHRSAASGQ